MEALRSADTRTGKVNSVQSATLLIDLNGGGSQVNHEERDMNKSNATCKFTSTAPVRAVEAHLADLDDCADKFQHLSEIFQKIFRGEPTIPPWDIAIAGYALAEVNHGIYLARIEALKTTMDEMVAGDVVELKLIEGAADG